VNVTLGWTRNFDIREKRCLQNFGGETCWRAATLKTDKGLCG
jgi:hypothetical protein